MMVVDWNYISPQLPPSRDFTPKTTSSHVVKSHVSPPKRRCVEILLQHFHPNLGFSRFPRLVQPPVLVSESSLASASFRILPPPKVSSVAHHLGLVGEVAGPVIFWAQRLSSMVFGTAILLVWRPPGWKCGSETYPWYISIICFVIFRRKMVYPGYISISFLWFSEGNDEAARFWSSLFTDKAS